MAIDNFTVILTHERADFDALASLLGASLLFPRTIPVLPRSINRNGRAFLALYRNQLPFIEPKEMPKGHVDLAIIVDTDRANAVKGMDDETRYLVIDHHTAEDPLPDGYERWQEALGPLTVGANTTLLVEKMMVQQRDLSQIHATLLLIGIYEDTGSLTYRSTTHRDARCAAWLLEQGANLEVLNRFINYPLSEEQQALSKILTDRSEHLEIAGHTIVVATAEAPDFHDELSALAHKLRDLYDPEGIFVIVDLGDHVQVVARSNTDAVDVGAVAEALGGGGHSRAAAALVREGDVEGVRQRVIALLRKHVRPPVTVRQIMSRGYPQIVAHDSSVAEAAERMRRYGHEGFPVVDREQDQEKLVGILTRREADRAIDHKMGDRPVHKVMQAGAVTVHADAPIEELHRTMIESGWGQIPVVDDDGAIVGIVTRTDLIKLWGVDSTAEQQIPDVTQQLNEVLTAGQRRLLQIAGETASEMGQSVYVVGGFVRDLLLGRLGLERSSFDMDIVIEGDAIELVETLQAECGGRVVTHRRFGTAKWILDDEAQPIHCAALKDVDTLPPTLDFVTARTEFYTEPTVLPTVAQGSIKLDLHRRDFTINTLAVALTPDRWGDLLDFYGGLADLRQGLIRVLHSLSFVDDPTRILRAVRYEQRFDFTIEERTLELLQDAVELIDRVSPARIRHELERILQERMPEKALRRLDELDVLAAIHPQLHADDRLSERFARLRRRLHEKDPLARTASAGEHAEPIERLYWGVLVYPILPAQEPPDDDEDVDRWDTDQELIERLMLRGETKRIMRKLRLLKARLPELLAPAASPSQITTILDRATLATLFILSVVEEDPLLRERLHRYVTEWRHVRPSLDGTDLRQMGIQPGPIYGEILRRLRAALLDGEIEPGEAEWQLVVKFLNDEESL